MSFPPPSLRIEAWPDELVEAVGFAPTHPYLELVTLSQIGPSSLWTYRRLAGGLMAAPDGYQVELAELARAIGLGTGTGHNAPISRTINRLVSFDFAAKWGESTLAVRRKVGPLSARQVARLSPQLAQVHHRLVAGHRPASAASVAGRGSTCTG